MSAIPHSASIAPGRMPTGTVSFAFTDIEGSTRRWDRDRAAMQDAVRRHDAVMRAQIAAHAGYVFKTIGDAFCAAFWRPEDAVAAMLGAQRALAAEDFSAAGGIRVRAAVHTGTADERDGDYFGPTVNRVARLLSIGHGGQVLVSGVAQRLVRAALPADAVLRDLGEHRLKDLAAPEHVFELVTGDLPAAHPPLRSLDAHPNNLPVTPTAFIGRAAEIADITALLETHRLVTVVGAGGIGKTRVSLQVAANLLDGSGDGVWFIELAPLASGDYVPAAVAQELGLVLGADGDPVAKLVAALAPMKALFIFDNCEHIVGAAGRLIGAILRGCANVAILATSRQALGIAGEQTYRLPSLALPARTGDETLSANDAARSSAVALFVERAVAVDRRFALTDANASIVADICRRLDGIALAIELAAARVRILSPLALRDRLDERFRVLTGGSRDALPRQQTLRALIDWSYDLLDERERALFRRLGVFVNGFTLAAATAVAGDGDFDEFDVIDILSSLVDQSLVLGEDAGDALRYRMLESTRAYALERIRAAGEFDALAARHAAFFAALAGDGLTFNASIASALSAVEIEIDNIREVLDWSLQKRNDVALGARLAFALGRFWSTRLPREGQRWLELAQSAVGADGDAVIAANLAMAIAAMLPHGSFERIEATQRALARARGTADPRILTRALSAYGEQLTPLERTLEARAAFEEALEQARAIASGWDTARALAGLATLAVDRGDIATAREIGRDAIALFAGLDATDGVAYVSILLGEGEFFAGNIEGAVDLMGRARSAYGELHNNRSSACAANHLAALSLVANRPREARLHARDALALLEHDRHPFFFTGAIDHLAYVATLEGDAQRGSLLAGYVQAAFERLAHSRPRAAQLCYERHVLALKAALGDDEYARRVGQGAQLSEDAALAQALSV